MSASLKQKIHNFFQQRFHKILYEEAWKIPLNHQHVQNPLGYVHTPEFELKNNLYIYIYIYINL